MKKYVIHKVSAPSSSHVFGSYQEAFDFLKTRICYPCLKGGDYTDTSGLVIFSEPDLSKTNSISDLLGTDCGCEYNYEVIYEH